MPSQQHHSPSYQNPTFRIYSHGKAMKTTLLRARIKHFTMAPASIPSIIYDHGKAYQIRLDMTVRQEACNYPVPIIISFQEHTYGNFAIIRIEEKTK